MVVTLAIFWSVPPRRSSVAHHLNRLESLRHGPFLAPRTLRDWFRWDTIQWLWQGQPTYNNWMDALESEQQALIKLGYYERRWIWVPTRWNDLQHPTLKGTTVGKTRFAICGDRARPDEVRVTARPRDIDEYAQRLRTLY